MGYTTCFANILAIPANAFPRSAVSYIRASTASLALCSDGNHKVTLDQVIATMRQTGLDMQVAYRETSRGGLAVNAKEVLDVL